jgi:hypothetical protein
MRARIANVLRPARAYWRDRRTSAAEAWNAFWFTAVDPTTLAAIRICVGLMLLYIHLSYTPGLLDAVGPQARIDATAIEALRAMLSAVSVGPDGATRDVWIGAVSVWFHVTAPAAIWIVHAVLLIAMACLTLGLFSRPASVVAWAGHVSFIDRGYMVGFGLDAIVAMLSLYLMFGPSGQALSLDRVIARSRAAARPTRRSARSDRQREFVTANVVIRLIQVHMGIVYLAAGLAKLQGSSWWDGTAVYLTMMSHDLGRLDMRWLATYDWLWQAVSSAGTWFTIAVEVGFAFLVWHRPLRPLVLGAALLLHVGIGLSMGLWAFSAAMLTGCLAFVPPPSLRWLLHEVFPGGRETAALKKVSRA